LAHLRFSRNCLRYAYTSQRRGGDRNGLDKRSEDTSMADQGAVNAEADEEKPQ